MRSALLTALMFVACTKDVAPAEPLAAVPGKLTLEQQQELALAVPEGDVELTRAAQAAREAPALADRWVSLGQLWVRKARASNDPGQYLSAEGAAQVALSLQPNYSGALALVAIVSLNQHRFTEAKTTALSALAQRDDDLLALAALADATLELGDVEASTAAVQKMIDLKPNLPSYGRAAHLRWVRGDTTGAQELYRQAIDSGRNPKDPEPQAWMVVQSALIFFDQGDVDGAAAGFDFALSKVAGYPPALVGKARVALARQEPAAAAQLLEQALWASPLVETWVLLAEAREAAGDFHGANRAWSKAETLGRGSDPLALARGWTEAGMRVRESVELLRHEMTVRPNAQVEGALAWALHYTGDDKAALEASEHALRFGTADARLRFQHAAILATLERREAALVELEALEPRLGSLSPHLKLGAMALLMSLKDQLAVQ